MNNRVLFSSLITFSIMGYFTCLSIEHWIQWILWSNITCFCDNRWTLSITMETVTRETVTIEIVGMETVTICEQLPWKQLPRKQLPWKWLPRKQLLWKQLPRNLLIWKHVPWKQLQHKWSHANIYIYERRKILQIWPMTKWH